MRDLTHTIATLGLFALLASAGSAGAQQPPGGAGPGGAGSGGFR